MSCESCRLVKIAIGRSSCPDCCDGDHTVPLCARCGLHTATRGPRVGSCCCGGCGRVLRMNLETEPVCPYCGATDWSEVDEAALRAARNLTQGRLL